MSSNKLETFEIREVSRMEISGSPYNPRRISDTARRKLKKGVEAHGLVQPIVVNLRTMHVVGGHQRLALMDAAMRKSDYPLTVAAIDVDDKAEREINLLLNADGAMGEWDPDALAAMLDSMPIDLDASGLTPFDVQLITDNPNWAPTFQERPESAAEVERVKAVAERAKQVAAPSVTPEEAWEAGKVDIIAQKARIKQHDQAEFYFLLVFPDEAQRDRALTWLGDKPGAKYVDGELLLARIVGS